MATRGNIRTDLVLEIDGAHITPEKFLKAVRAFFVIVDEVTAEVAGEKDVISWRVQADHGRNLVGVRPEPGHSPALVARVTQAVSDGLTHIERAATAPAHFNERALRHLRDLATLAGNAHGDDTTIRIWVNKSPIAVTHNAASNVDEIVAIEHEDFGSIERRLETLPRQKGLQFVIHEPLGGQAICCEIAADELLEQAMANFRKRVEVYGTIKYRKDGKPVSIRVEEIVPFPASDKLPSFRELHGILGKASQAWIAGTGTRIASLDGSKPSPIKKNAADKC
jgi:hypothetical protein